MRTEVLYLSSVASAAQFDYMKQQRRPGVQEVRYGMIESGHKFHTLIQTGLIFDPNVSVTSVVGRPAEPAFYQGNYWPRSVEKINDQLIVDHLGFPMFRGVKQAWLAGGFAQQAWRWRKATQGADHRILIADAAYISALPGVFAALQGSDVTCVAIFADLYRYMAPVQDASERGSAMFELLRKLAPKIYDHLDGFILLTEQMNAVVNPRHKPAIVMEGLVDDSMAQRHNRRENKTPHPTVLYAGALRAEYGLENLVEGFRAWPHPEAQLRIFGQGDYVPQLQQAAEQDHRIFYGGTVPIAEVVEEEEHAWLLCNPRPIDQEFTQYSFPSKVMEYMVSGTPVLTTRLPGMPAQYYEHILTIDEPGAVGITEALSRSFAMSPQQLHQRGCQSKEFVLQHKTNVAQARRILDFATAL